AQTNITASPLKSCAPPLCKGRWQTRYEPDGGVVVPRGTNLYDPPVSLRSPPSLTQGGQILNTKILIRQAGGCIRTRPHSANRLRNRYENIFCNSFRCLRFPRTARDGFGIGIKRIDNIVQL